MNHDSIKQHTNTSAASPTPHINTKSSQVEPMGSSPKAPAVCNVRVRLLPQEALPGALINIESTSFRSAGFPSVLISFKRIAISQELEPV